MAREAEARPAPRRGLSATEAAMYVGISTSKFYELVGDGRMPAARCIDARKVWDRFEIDYAFDVLPRDDAAKNSWDDR